jgi:prepilin-type N-terminal cleavage/methylation domain-containing protein
MGRISRPGAARRGVTLVEMLVTVAILVIIMTVMVQIFQSATGALTAAQTIQDLDNQLKLLDSTIRTDLGGVTARFTPPLDPTDGLGYFEYIENEFADVQGEDSDDCLRFTAKAPAGQPFTGRMFVLPSALPANANPLTANQVTQYLQSQPVTITSEYAEIIYFLRNGNLYRRVLLIAPELQSAIVPSVGNQYFFGGATRTFAPGSLATNAVSWQGVNDLSARPATTGPNISAAANAFAAFAPQTIKLNTLGSLTNRENRFAAPRFADDFVTLVAPAQIGNAPTYTPGADGFSDDMNGDKLNDLYPSLYPNLFSFIANPTNTTLPRLLYVPKFSNNNIVPPFAGFLAFPYIFPGAYTVPQAVSNDQYGWIHSPTPVVFDKAGNPNLFEADRMPVPNTPTDARPVYLRNLNHNPLDLGDNSTIPDINTTPTAYYSPVQTWWGFPTWRETLSINWTDPTRQLNDGSNFTAFGQSNGLTPRPADVLPILDPNGQLLPWMSTPGDTNHSGPLPPPPFDFSIIRRTPQLYSDVLNYKTNMSVFLGTGGVIDPVWAVSWEDDLVMTNVRSFDVKGYDNAFGGFADLGWADDLRLWLPYQNMQGFQNPNNGPPGIAGTPPIVFWPPVFPGGVGYNTINETLAHEGRMPPIVADNRLDWHYPNPTYVNPTTFTPQYPGGPGNPPEPPAFPNYSSNVGDDTPGVVRLRRVWDSWSTDYSVAPDEALDGTTGQLQGPRAGYPPAYPSYPPPYAAPLRGIQIQIRVADPTNQRIKSLTIRQDFTDKL